MKKIFILIVLLSFSLSLRAQLTIDFAWCPVYDSSLQVCCIQFQNLTVDSGGGTLGGYIWDFGDGATDTSTDPLHCYPVTGTFIVYLTVFYNGNPVGPTSHTLTISHLDTTGCNCDSLIGVNEIASGDYSFSLAPNPFHERTVLKLHSNFNENIKFKDAEMRIYNSLGALMRIEKIVLMDEQEIIIERRTLSQGVYYFEISTNDVIQVGRGKFLAE